MSTNSGIEWTDCTWNPTTGCNPVSPGCANCYAKVMSRRLQGMAATDILAGRNPGKKEAYLNVIDDDGEWNGQVNFVGETLTIPFGWKKPRRVFVNSMSDLFWGTEFDLEYARRHGVKDPKPVSIEDIAKVFAVMGLASWHTFQVLTKRAERMATILASEEFQETLEVASQEWSEWGDDAAQRFGLVNVLQRVSTDWRAQDHSGLPLANVQLGVSVENQKVADDRIPWLLKCPAARRFLSCEPLLSAVDLCQVKAGILAPHLPLHRVDVLRGGTWNMPTGLVPPPEYTNHSDMERLDWVIIGGESGFGARACNLDWIRTIVQQCKAAGVACFVKQLGADPYYDPPVMTLAHAGLGPKNIRDPKGGNMAEWPEDMRVRDFPGAVPA